MVRIPHQCVKCGTMHGDSSNVILHGCTNCGSKVFFFVRKEQLEVARQRIRDLDAREREQIEKDIYDIMGDDVNRELPVVLDFETVSITGPGKYEIDLVNLMKKGNPIIYRLEDGKYMVDLVESLKRSGSASKRRKK